MDTSPEKVPKPQVFTEALKLKPGKFIDLASDDDDQPSPVEPAEPALTAVKFEAKTEPQPCAMLGALMSSESRVMDKKDKSVVTSGLKIIQHEDEVMKAMVGSSHLPESVHMLKDPNGNLPQWDGVNVMTVEPNWESTCKRLAARGSSQNPGPIAVCMENPTWNQIQDIHCESDMNQCITVVFTPYIENLVDKSICFGSDLCLFVAGDRDDALSRLAKEWNDGQVFMTPRTFQDACGMEFHELLTAVEGFFREALPRQVRSDMLCWRRAG